MMYVLSTFLLAQAFATTKPCDPSQFTDPNKTCIVSDDVALPYPVSWVLRGFDQCRNGKHKHQAVDIAGLGPEYGLGDPVRAMVKSEVVFVGRRSAKPAQFGRPDTRSKTVTRHGRQLPASKEIAGYGKVYFFTLDYGSSRTGEFLAVRGLEGKYADHEFRYMHMGAIRSDIKVGTVLEAGEPFGLMGGTAIMKSPPHLHVDIASPDGVRLDVMPILGLKSRHKPCGLSSSQTEKKTVKKPVSKVAAKKTPTNAKIVSQTSADAQQPVVPETSVNNVDSTSVKPKLSPSSDEPLSTPKSTDLKPSTKWVKSHTVAQGETLSSIAVRYGLTVGAILKANSLQNPDRIREGQLLSLPKPLKKRITVPVNLKKWRLHTIVEGDHLSGIAIQYGCSVEQLMNWNNLKSDKIYQGQVLKIAR